MDRFQWLRDQERKILFLLNGSYHTPALDRAMKAVTNIGGATFSSIVLLLSIMLFRLPLDGLIALVVSHLIIQIMKRSFKRRRPYNVESSIRFSVKPLKDCSFPSGHTTAVFATAVSFALLFPMLSPLLLIAACLVGWSRIYLGLHYPADVFVGALIGAITAVIVFIV